MPVVARTWAQKFNLREKTKNDEEMQLKEIMIEGLLSIQAGENPRVIEEKLKSFLAPQDRGNGNEGGELDG